MLRLLAWNSYVTLGFLTSIPYPALHERVLACLKALAIGDAVGKQTETLSRAGVRKWYPSGIQGFEGVPGMVIPRYIGKRYEWRIGETTDDTEQTLAVGKALLKHKRAGHEAVGRELLQCRKSLHPGVRLWSFHQAADPAAIASEGDGCGAAMRVSPIGMAYPFASLSTIVDGAFEASIPTHGGQLAICAAAAVAAAVSAAIEEQDADRVLAAAIDASRKAEALRPSTSSLRFSERIEAVCTDLSQRNLSSADDIPQEYFPSEPRNIVPLAIGLALMTQSAEKTTLLAANLGGDSDSVASIGSAIAGALCPDSVRDDWFSVVGLVNRAECDELSGMATELSHMRLGEV